MRRSSLAVAIFAIFAATTNLAHATACSDEIARLRLAARRFATIPAAGPTAQQSIGAQLGRQPTPDSVKQAEQWAQSRFAFVLVDAETLDAQGKHAECMQAVADAKRMLEPN
jgi:hypothetical protein